MSKRTLLQVAFGAALLLLFLVTQFRIQPDARPPGAREEILSLAQRDDLNIVFLLIDTLRADRLGVHGYERPTSPALDHLARTGIRFARHHAQSSWTKTSMASLWTAMYPSRNGILRYDHALPESATLPAELLREEGMRTAGIWRNGWVAPTFGFHQGFEIYHKPSDPVKRQFNRRDAENPYAQIAGSDISATDGAIEFMRTNGQDRFFLYVHYMDLHQYLSDEESALFGTAYSDLYDNSIHWTDRHVGAILNALDDLGLRDQTIVIVTSDHGEAFREHGNEGHAKDLHREVIHIPWILSLPFSLEPGIVVESISETVDVWPTIFDLLGLAPMDGVDGRSRLPEIFAAAGLPSPEDAPVEPKPLFAQLDRTWGQASRPADPIVALTLPDRRFIRSLGDEPTRALFATDDDPLEQRDLLAQGEEVDTSELEALVDEVLQQPPPEWLGDVEQVELDDMQKGQLRAIGYAIE